MMPRFGLRTRVIAAFGVGALLLSVLLSSVIYSFTRDNLLEQRLDVAFENAGLNAELLDSRLATSDGDPTQFARELSRLVLLEGSHLGLVADGQYTFIDSLVFNGDDLDPEFQQRVADGEAVEMSYKAPSNEPFYAIAFPFEQAPISGAYIEAYSLDDLAATFTTLRFTLIAAALTTTILGTAFGFYVASRLFRPLGDISTAASQISAGDLSTRIDEIEDPDLQGLVTSFNEMTSNLERRIERDARFASDVSHELRSPLMTLTGSVAVLERRREEMPERAKTALDLLSNDITRFKVLVEDLLEISRFDVGAVELDIDEALLDDFVQHAVAAATNGDPDVVITSDEETVDVIVEIDKRRIAQVIRNLCENAAKYADGITNVRLSRVGDDVRIELEDRGPGVPIDERELIFERFARGSEGGRRGSSSGVGLGLSLVREHITLHGGSIYVTDRLDLQSGARFVIELPGVVTE